MAYDGFFAAVKKLKNSEFKLSSRTPTENAVLQRSVCKLTVFWFSFVFLLLLKNQFFFKLTGFKQHTRFWTTKPLSATIISPAIFSQSFEFTAVRFSQFKYSVLKSTALFIYAPQHL